MALLPLLYMATQRHFVSYKLFVYFYTLNITRGYGLTADIGLPNLLVSCQHKSCNWDELNKPF